MQNLTRRDIERYVEQELGDRCDATLVSEILRRAEGVFLWVKIAVQDLRSAIDAGDSIVDLKRRIYRLPNGLEALFSHMLERIDPEHQKDAGTYFQHVLSSDHRLLSICELVFAFNNSYFARKSTQLGDLEVGELLKECETLKKRVECCTAGLLEVSDTAESKFKRLGDSGKRLDFTNDTSRYSPHESLQVFLFGSTPNLIHRTVEEFLSSKGGLILSKCPPAIVSWSHLQSFIVTVSLWKHFEIRNPVMLSNAYLETMKHASIAEKSLKKGRMNHHLARLQEVSYAQDSVAYWASLPKPSCCFSTNFFELCAETNLCHYLEQTCLKEYEKGACQRQEILNSMLRAATSWGLFERNPCQMVSRRQQSLNNPFNAPFKLILLLLRQGANPTAPGLRSISEGVMTAWEGFIGLIASNFAFGRMFDCDGSVSVSEFGIEELIELFLRGGTSLDDRHKHRVPFSSQSRKPKIRGYLELEASVRWILQLARILSEPDDLKTGDTIIISMTSRVKGKVLTQHLTPEGSEYLVKDLLAFWKQSFLRNVHTSEKALDVLARLRQLRACAENPQSPHSSKVNSVEEKNSDYLPRGLQSPSLLFFVYSRSSFILNDYGVVYDDDGAYELEDEWF